MQITYDGACMSRFASENLPRRRRGQGKRFLEETLYAFYVSALKLYFDLSFAGLHFQIES
jgi:hypothetical protein